MARFVRRTASLGALLVLLAVSPARAEMEQLRIGIQSGLPSLPVIVADQQGLFAEQAKKAGLGDLKVTTQRFSGAAAAIDALRSERVDAGVLGVTALLSAWDMSKDREGFRVLAPLAVLDVILFTNRPEIKSFLDFGEQDRIAVPASVSPQAILMRMAAEKFYGPGKSVKVEPLLLTMPHPDATAALLAGKTITGYVASQPFSMVLSKSDRVHAVITAKEILDGEEPTGAGLAAGRKFVDANPTLAQGIIAALQDAMAFIASNPAQAADLYLKSESSNITKADVVEQLTGGGMVYSMEPRGFMKFARFMARTGQLKNEPSSWQDVFFPFLHTRNGN
jgi:sulfonate transport system substrate-binding protein